MMLTLSGAEHEDYRCRLLKQEVPSIAHELTYLTALSSAALSASGALEPTHAW